jgi:hypothetical protein
VTTRSVLTFRSAALLSIPPATPDARTLAVMTEMKRFEFRFRLKEFLVLLTGTICLIIGAKHLVILTDIELLERMSEFGKEGLVGLDNAPVRLGNFLLFSRMFQIIGLLISLFLTYKISRHSLTFFANAVLMVLVGVLIIWTKILNYHIVKMAIGSLGKLFSGFGYLYVYLVTAIFFLGLGLFIFKRGYTK